MPLHSRLAAERAHITGVLRDFHLLDLFAEGGAVSGMLLEEVVATWVSGGGLDLVPYLPVTPTSVEYVSSG